MTSRNTKLVRPEDAPRVPALQERYGAIGISAVAAALRYQGEGKNPAYARVEPSTERADELAA